MEDIIVKDRNGNDVTHERAERIRTRTTDGGTKEFVSANNIPEPVKTSVELDFSSGDMEVVPNDGEVFSAMTIGKPDTLIPENIVKDVNIAGIVGAFAGAGSVAIASGKISGDKTSKVEITHGLGAIPDIVMYVGASATSVSSVCMTIGVSEALSSKIGRKLNRYVRLTSNGIVQIEDGYDTNLFTGTGSSLPVNNVTEETFCLFASSTFKIKNGGTWIAIAGLT